MLLPGLQFEFPAAVGRFSRGLRRTWSVAVHGQLSQGFGHEKRCVGTLPYFFTEDTRTHIWSISPDHINFEIDVQALRLLTTMGTLAPSRVSFFFFFSLFFPSFLFLFLFSFQSIATRNDLILVHQVNHLFEPFNLVSQLKGTAILRSTACLTR